MLFDGLTGGGSWIVKGLRCVSACTLAMPVSNPVDIMSHSNITQYEVT